MHQATDEERALAALAHAGIIANGFNLLGIIGAALIWAFNRKRSAYVADHALKALAFQGLGLLITLVMAFAWGGCMLISLLPALLRPELYRTGPPALFWFALLLGLVILAFALSGIVYGLIGAWAAWRGQPFRYMGVDVLLERPAAPQTAPSTSESAPPTEAEKSPRQAADKDAADAPPPATDDAPPQASAPASPAAPLPESETTDAPEPPAAPSNPDAGPAEPGAGDGSAKQAE